MKLPIAALALSIAFLALPASAQQARIRTGEHRDFTRLVVMLPAPADWSLRQTETGYDLTVDEGKPQFDLTGAFARIDRTRIRKLGTRPGILHINDGDPCECRAEAFEFRPGIVVVDFRDGKPEAPPATSMLPTILPTGKTLPATGGAFAGPVMPDVPRNDLVLQFARSIATDRNLSLGSAEGEAEAAAASALPKNDPCRIGDDLNIASWTPSDGDLASGIASARSDLMDTRDDLDTDAAMTLARRYIAAGFGAEALQILGLVGEDEGQAAMLGTVARLIDAPGIAEPRLNGMETCRSPVALWAVLARDHLRLAEPIAAADIIITFLQLPPNLKMEVFPELVSRLSEAGYEAEIARLRNDMDRLLASAETGSRYRNAADLLAPPASLRTPREAAIRAKDTLDRLAAGQQVSTGAVDDLDALLHQTRRPEDREALLRALALAKANAGQFETALKLSEATPGLRAEVIAVLSRRGSDNDLLLHVRRSDAAQIEDTETSAQLARRFRALGFGDEARFWEQRAGRDPVTSGRQMAENADMQPDAPMNGASDASTSVPSNDSATTALPLTAPFGLSAAKRLVEGSARITADAGARPQP
jgi:hypothetical protein